MYWRRRLFVLGLAASLVFLIASLLTDGSDARSTETPVAAQAGAQVEASDTMTSSTTATTTAVTTPAAGRKARTQPTPTPTPTLAVPQGNCDAADISVTPVVDKAAVAGRDVTIALSLQTTESEACTWRVAPDRVTVKIARGDEEIWSTRHCRRVVPSQAVVVRRAVPTVVRMTWNARESAEGCRRATRWVRAGDYTIAAAALGGEPTVADFALASPTPETIYVTPKSESTKTAAPKTEAATPTARATGR
ncbi:MULTISPECIES: hypothetical protein [Nocardioides]|uniref:DUF4232 domain-containing protein n=1 Tax=Nocardioides vastitatis TaxID=2568655 RepID=A0ABW0ZDD6_9ACTN|nr:hypothetical protein [Nocardioides sp.]THI97635.1 hypothetical protein E7Z54_14530 [Nocardioides sp.]